MATFNPFRRRRSCWELIRENIKTMVNKVRNVSNLEEMKELNDGLQRKHVMIIHVIKMMNDDQVENFIDKLTSFIIPSPGAKRRPRAEGPRAWVLISTGI